MDPYRKRIFELYHSDKEHFLCEPCQEEQYRRNSEYGRKFAVSCGLCAKGALFDCYLHFMRIEIKDGRLCLNLSSNYRVDLDEADICRFPVVCRSCVNDLFQFYDSLPPRTDPEITKRLNEVLLERHLPRELCEMISQYSFQRLHECPARLWHQAAQWEESDGGSFSARQYA